MKALVTGGGGFLGRAIVRRLLARSAEVEVLARGSYPDLKALGVTMRQADVADADAVKAACKGKDVVFHVAARVGTAGSHDDFWRANVTGTDNVIAGCVAHGVSRLVYTSSPSVVFDGTDQRGVDESYPYPKAPLGHYSATKAEGERRVLVSNGKGGLTTTSLRPHLVFGPGDTSLLPRVVDRARKGQLAQVGDGHNRVDVCYIDNAAEAHLLAAQSERAAGKAYFITNGEPVRLWEFIARILDGLGLPPVKRRVPFAVAYAMGAALEKTHALLGLSGEPRMTRFLAAELAHDHWYDVSAARRDLGYEPAVSVADGLRRLIDWWKENPAPG